MPAYEIGKSYRVPTVRVVSRGRWPIPILLPLHDDLEIIGFPYDHWNGDPRFMSDQQLIAYMEGMRMVGAPVGPESDAVSVLSFPISVRVSMKIDNPQLRAQVSASHPRYVSEKPGTLQLEEFPKIVYRRRRCWRRMPSWAARSTPTWLPALEDCYKGERIKDLASPRCPHRNICLEGLPEHDGVVECPGHGLRWDLRDGTLVAWAKDDVKGDGPA